MRSNCSSTQTEFSARNLLLLSRQRNPTANGVWTSQRADCLRFHQTQTCLSETVPPARERAKCGPTQRRRLQEKKGNMQTLTAGVLASRCQVPIGCWTGLLYSVEREN